MGFPWQTAAAAAVGVGIGICLEKLRRVQTVRSSSDVVKSGVDVFVKKDQLEEAVASCLKAVGTPPDKAALVAKVLVAADCRGIPSHGVNRAEMYCGELKAGLIDPEGQPEDISGFTQCGKCGWMQWTWCCGGRIRNEVMHSKGQIHGSWLRCVPQ